MRLFLRGERPSEAAVTVRVESSAAFNAAAAAAAAATATATATTTTAATTTAADVQRGSVTVSNSVNSYLSCGSVKARKASRLLAAAEAP